LKLYKLCTPPKEKPESEEAAGPITNVSIARMKNLFYTSSPLGVLPSSPLPTGYRHILFNVQLDGKSTGKIIAEIQCHLAPLYYVLEDAGCKLHRDIQELERLLEMKHDGDESVAPKCGNLGKSQLQAAEPQQDKLAANSSELHNSSEEQKTPLVDVGKARDYSVSDSSAIPRTGEAEEPRASPERQLKNKDIANSVSRKGDTSSNPFDMNELISSICGLPLENIELGGLSGDGNFGPNNLNDSKTPLRSNVGSNAGTQENVAESPQPTASPTKSAPRNVEPLASPRTPMPSDHHNKPMQTMETLLGEVDDSAQNKSCASNGEASIADLETPKAGRALRQVHGAPDMSSKEEGDCDLLAALIGFGARTVWKDPRDAGSFNCLFSVLSFVLRQDSKVRSQANSASGTVPSEELVELSRACLRRCLVLGDQGTCTGMTGWVEHQLSGPLRRMSTETPFTLLHRLACSYASSRKWIEAEDIFCALLLRSEQNFPLYHPTVLIALLDLAAVSVKNSKQHFAKMLVARVAERLASYLAEMECAHMAYLDQCIVINRPGGYLCQMDEGRDALSMLKAFVESFQAHLHREFVGLITDKHEIVLIHRTFLGDAFSVLANCTTASNMVIGRSDSKLNSSASFWGVAFVHYRAAFQGFVQSKGLEDPSTACAAYGAARCLRELGATEKAMTVLSTVTKVLFDRADQESSQADEPESKNATQNRLRAGRQLTFLPSASLSRSRLSYRMETRRLFSSALCYWLMAVLAADSQQDEEGRLRALKLLHKASVSLQRSLKITPTDDDASRTTCIELLRKIEDEARSILQPIGPMPPDSFAHHNPRRGQRSKRLYA
jgi:hypothetical protein